MSSKNLNLKRCEELSYYAEEKYEYIRSSRKRGHNKRTKHNSYYPEIIDIFEKAFKPITASKKDIPFMEAVFCYPLEACDTAQKTIEQISKSLQSQGIDPREKFKELREEYIKGEFLADIIRTAKRTLPSDSQTGREAARIWCGEKGCGKTTLINHIFLKYSEEFDKNNIIWIRTSVFYRALPRNIDDIKNKFYNKCIQIISEFYSDRLSLDSYDTKCQIWEGEYDLKSDPKDIRERIKILERNKENYAKRLIKWCYKNGWAFVFIIDNIDHFQKKNKIVEDIINYALELTHNPVRSLVIIVSRWETIIDHHKFLHNCYNNFKYIESVPKPNFSDVFARRLAYIKNKIADSNSYISLTFFGKTIKVPKSQVIDEVINYFLAVSPTDDEGYIISDLSNNNIRKMFSMIETVLKSHIEDVIAVPLIRLLRGSKGNKTKYSKFDDTLRQHIIIWALSLKDGYLFYKDHISRSWIQNIYSTSKPSQSIFLKRIILDFMYFMAREKGYDSVDIDTIKNVFVVEMGLPEKEFDESINYLTARDERSPFLVYRIADSNISHNETSLCISQKGILYSKYLAELFTYLELIIEDMLLPISDQFKESSLDFDLIEYDPLLISKKHRRKEYRISYFHKKKIQVLKFLDFLECRYLLELSNYNNFKSNKLGFSVNYFPGMKERVRRQIQKIERSFERTYA